MSIDRHPTSEKMQKMLGLVQRFMLVKDNDGHTYLIPLYSKIAFERWLLVLEDGDGDIGPGEGFEDCLLPDGILTFTDPQVS